MNDLIPALESQAALAIYVDLWSDVKANPGALIPRAIRKAMVELQSPSSALMQRLSAIKNLELAAAGFKFGFKIDSVGMPEGSMVREMTTKRIWPGGRPGGSCGRNSAPGQRTAGR
ncbi:MAG: hypothetical protein ABW202_22725 [Duganella sp.]